MQSNEEFVKFLGEGSFGSVNLIKYTKPDGSSFQAAVKSSYSLDYDSLNNEFQILSELRGYPGIVRCYGDNLEDGFSPNGHKVYKLLLEYASEGSLSHFMDNYVDRKLPESMIKDFTFMILEGLVSIHGHGYVHCDLKSDNLLVFPRKDSSFELKISDFGNSLEVGEVPSYWETNFPFVGTPIYMSPESLEDGVAKKAIDLWSLGCLVLEMYTGVAPWQGVNLDDLATLLIDGKAPEIPASVPCDAREFIETCFSRNPDDRGSASELLFHRFLHREEEKMDDSVAVDENSLMLKLRLRIRKALKKAMDINEKPLKMNVLTLKSPKFKKILNKLLRLKNHSLKHWDSNLVSVQ